MLDSNGYVCNLSRLTIAAKKKKRKSTRESRCSFFFFLFDHANYPDLAWVLSLQVWYAQFLFKSTLEVRNQTPLLGPTCVGQYTDNPKPILEFSKTNRNILFPRTKGEPRVLYQSRIGHNNEKLHELGSRVRVGGFC
jgi:hypothetical protein